MLICVNILNYKIHISSRFFSLCQIGLKFQTDRAWKGIERRDCILTDRLNKTLPLGNRLKNIKGKNREGGTQSLG